MTSKRVRIIKFGGACITKKDQIETFNEHGIKWCVETLLEMQKSEEPIIIVCGAGSFGHFQAKKYQLTMGVHTVADKTDVEQIRVSFLLSNIQNRKREMAIGMAETKIALLTLQQYFIKQLVNAGIPAVSVSPSSLLRMYTQTKDSSPPLDKIEQLSQFSNQIQQHIENGLVPVLHGDVVLDDVQGTNVLSGDVIVEMLSAIFAAPIVYFVTDVSGVYTHAPSEQDETTANGLICDIKVGEELTFEMFGKQENAGGPKFTLVHAHDVTGGLEEKMRNALAIVRNNNQVQVFIMKCNTDDARKVMVSGIREEHVRATRIHQ